MTEPEDLEARVAKLEYNVRVLQESLINSWTEMKKMLRVLNQIAPDAATTSFPLDELNENL